MIIWIPAHIFFVPKVSISNIHVPAPSILLLNARSIATPGKIDDLILSCSTYKPDCCVVTESWLNDSHDSSLFHIPGYSLLRCDRANRIGGGVALWYSTSLRINILTSRLPSFCEGLFLSVSYQNVCYILGCFYIPPDLKTSERTSIVDYICDFVDDRLNIFPNNEIILVGDFNNVNVNSLCTRLNLVKKVTASTRGDSILDQCLVSEHIQDVYPDAVVGPPLSSSRRGSHGQIHLKPYASKLAPLTRTCSVLDLRETHIRSYITACSNASFRDVFREPSVDGKVDNFYKIFRNCIEVIPRTTVHIYPSDKPWMKPWLKHLINQRWSAYRARDFQEYNRLNIVIKRAVINCKNAWYSESSTRCDKMWRVVADVSGKKSASPLDAILTRFPDTESATEHINSVLCDTFTEKHDFVIPESNSDWAPLIDVIDIYNIIDKLDSKKAVGSDDISNRLYKLAAPYIAEPLCNIINSSIIDRKVPAKFKACDVSPVPKSQLASEYQLRPITLLSIPNKLLEYFVLKDIKSKILSNVPNFQFAYRPKSNTTCALISLHDSVTRYLDSVSVDGVAIISYDFSKAFDHIPHHALLGKFVQLDFPSNFIIWLSDYLDNRQQCVRVNGVRSSYMPVTSGAPQGSLLGPFLFLIMCFDFRPEHASTAIIQYADDISEGCPIYKNLENVISEEYRNIQQWSLNNGFSLNASKTQCLIIWKKPRLLRPVLDLPFTVTACLKILGVTWSDDLTWDSHFSEIELKCSRRLYMLRVLKQTLNHDELWAVFFSMIESLMFYATELFGNFSVSTNAMIKRIYRRAERIICTNCHYHHVNNFFTKRKSRIISLLEKSMSLDHPLHSLAPFSIRDRVTVPIATTVRRRNCFTVYSAILARNVHID